ncbi:MAG: hypothetical protein R3C58_07265 [Parvularculaceae bacterium]
MQGINSIELAIFIALYVAAQIAVGLWFARGAKSEKDFFLAGGRLGFLPITLSLFATWFGAETILGSSAAVAEGGLSGARAEPFGYAICLVGMALLIVGPIRQHGFVTVADFIRVRFGVHAEVVTAAISIVISVIWAGAQLLAIAAILETAIGVPGVITLFVAAIVVIFYCSFGGLMGDVVTDVIQSVFLIAGVALLFFMLAAKFGGVGAMLTSIEPDQLRLVAPGESVFGRADAWAIPVIGSLVTQEAITRFLAARSTAVAKSACYAAALLYVGVGALPVIIGLAGAHMHFPGAEGDNFIPAVAVNVLSPFLAILFIGALFSAILSTVDSNLLAVSSFFTINILKGVHRRSSERQRLMTARLTTAAAGIAALAVALAGSNIYDLIALTSIFGQGGILIAVMFGLRTRLGGPAAALASIYACVSFNIATMLIMPLMDAMGQGMSVTAALQAVVAGDVEPMDGYFLYSIAVSIIAYVAVALVTPRHAPAAA